MVTCAPFDDPNNNYQQYCPNIGAAAFFTVALALTTIGHVFQAVQLKKRFCWVLIMGALWETISFLLRCLSINSPDNKGLFSASFVLLVLAPLWVNAFDYMVLARLVYMYLPDQKLVVKGSRLGVYFVLLDVTSFFIQLIGAVSTVGNNSNTAKTGFYVYTAGVGIQQAVIVAFMVMAIVFLKRVERESGLPTVPQAKRLVWILLLSCTLITIRIVFRIVEFSSGQGSTISNNIRASEAYLYCFDALPVFLAVISMHLFHPGQVLVGPESEFGSGTKPAEKDSSSQDIEFANRA